MRTSSLLAAATAAAATLASAAEERPRIYFPRHVKRLFINATVSKPFPHPAPLPTLFSETAPQTSKRQSLSDLLFGDGTTTGSESDGGFPTTIVVESTAVVGSPLFTEETPSSQPDVGTKGTAPASVAQPTASASSLESSDGSSSGSSESTDSTTGIVLWPTGAVTSSSTPDGPLGPIGSLLSSVASAVTSAVLPPLSNATASDPPVIIPTTTAPPIITISLPAGPTQTPNVTATTPDPPPLSTLTLLPPPPNSTTIQQPPPPPPTSTSSQPNVTDTVVPPPPPTSTTFTLPPSPTGNATAPGNTTIIADPPATTDLLPTSAPPASATWLPSTILVQPTASTPRPSGLVPTTATGLPTGLPKAITPDSGNEPPPDDTTEIQIAFLYGLNYGFVAVTPKAAAQVLKTLPQLLTYQGGFDPEKVVVRRLVPYDTMEPLGYVTMLAITTYPTSLVDQLRLDMHAPSAPLWNNPNSLAYNMSLEINTAIDILLGSTLEWSPNGVNGGQATSTSGPNDMFNGDESSNQTPAQKGMTAGLAVGAVFISAAYGGAMFIIARRYKKKKQSHHRTSSTVTPSTMRQTASPALMGGALLSRDFTSTYGGVAGGRDSHGSGRSGGNNSGRTAYISAPVAAENSLGWN